MSYKYEFDKDYCPYRKVCKLYDTQDCNGSCIRYMKMHYLLENSLLTKKQQSPAKLLPDDVDIKAYEDLDAIKRNIVEFVNSGKNLVICSASTGNGKTTWAVKLIMKYFSEIWSTDSFNTRGLFINVAKYLSELKSNISQKSDYISHIRENVLDADIVIWDDLGSKDMTQFEFDEIFNIIENRVELGKTNICTSNNTKEKLKEMFGDRLYSRLVIGGKLIVFYGKDHRGGSL